MDKALPSGLSVPATPKPAHTDGAQTDEATAKTDGNELNFICWDEERMTTGIPAIDDEHKELIRNLNELYRAHRAGAAPDDIKKILKFLGRYAETHFRHEEAEMEARQCPARKENRYQHARFLSTYQELVSNFSMEDDPDQIAAEIENMAARWLSCHICRVDAGLRDCPVIAPQEEAKAGK